MTLLVLLACTAAPGSFGARSPVDQAGQDARLPLPLVAEAEDLDPAAGALHVALTAAAGTHSVEGVDQPADLYNGQVPGPTLHATVGDTLTVDLQNALADSTTIHWHGIAAPNDMDGVTILADPVPAGLGFTYAMSLDHAGTYWYHPHVDTHHQVDLGLYGVVVVDDPAEPAFDDDLVLVFDAWGEAGAEDDANDQGDHHGVFNPSDFPWTVNGVVDPTWSTTTSRTLRARLVNTSNTSYLDIAWPGAVRIAGDQGLLGATDTPDHVFLAPGDRAEIAWAPIAGDTDVTTTVYVPAGGDAWEPDVRLFTVHAEDDGAATLPALGDGAVPTADDGRTTLTYVFAGGPSEDGDGWLINGEAWPDVTVESIPLGEPSVIEVRNLSATEHPFHLHGNAFEVLSVDGVAPASADFEDTVNVPIRSVVRLRLVPTNPGDWLLHCHLLGHEDGGMMTILRVE